MRTNTFHESGLVAVAPATGAHVGKLPSAVTARAANSDSRDVFFGPQNETSGSGTGLVIEAEHRARSSSGQSTGLRSLSPGNENGERRRRPWQDRFWEKAQPVGDCLVWTSSKSSAGYGQFTFSYAPKHWVSAHRLAWLLYHGEWPAQGMVVMHTCDNRLCIARDHLRLGTVADNNRDAAIKGRARCGGSSDFLYPPRRRNGRIAIRQIPDVTPANTNAEGAR